MSYQKTTGPLMANSHPGSYCGQDAYSDMLITEPQREREREWAIGNGQLHQLYLSRTVGALNCMHDQQMILCMRRED